MTQQPEKIGKYVIVGRLGEGAMGVVYEGFDPDIERKVAIKVLRRELAGSEESDFLARFKREAQAVAKCHHQNIVLILEYGTDGDMPYMVMEYVQGWSLAGYLQRKDRLSLKHSLILTVKVLKALQAAHSKGVVHRDIKPANIMITETAEVKLTDFGIARHVAKADLTRTGLQIGTPAYMSPEQVAADRTDSRTDLYSLSIVLLELLTRIPGNGRDNPMRAINMDKGISLHSKISADVPVPSLLAPVIEKGLQKNPDNRYQTAGEFMADIIAVFKRLNLGDGGQSEPRPAAAVTARAADPDTVVAPHILRDAEAADVVSPMAFDMSSSLVDPATYEAMREALEKLIGDRAGEVIRDEMAMNLSRAEAVYAIAQHIKKSRQQSKFIDCWSG